MFLGCCVVDCTTHLSIRRNCGKNNSQTFNKVDMIFGDNNKMLLLTSVSFSVR